MRMKLNIQVSEQTGHSFVEASHEELWELVEQLSNQRAAVNYTYHEDRFVVNFHNLNKAAVQKLLSEWNAGQCAIDNDTPVEAAAMYINSGNDDVNTRRSSS